MGVKKIVGALLGVALAVGVVSAAHAAGAAQKAVVAMYSYPGATGMWQTAVSSSPVPNTIILDVSGSGPGAAPDPAYQSWVARAQAKGTTVLGYVDTGYGSRAAAEIQADVRNYASWYSVHDIFLDQVSSSWSQAGAYYQDVTKYIRSYDQGKTIWLNPGVFPDEQFMGIADTVMVFESDYATYTAPGYRQPAWVANYLPGRFAHVVHTASTAARMQDAITKSRQRNAGFVYVTDRTMPNPYSDFPSYWTTENQAINTP